MPMSKVDMPKDLKVKCNVIIHAASATSGGSAAVPIPVADTIPITAAQVTMIIALGNVFGLTIKESVAKSIISCGIAQNVGRTISSTILKSIPVVNVTIAPFANAAIASVITEILGWMVADDFYRISIGEEPENITNGIDEIANGIEKLFKKSTKNTKSSKSNGMKKTVSKKK